LPFGRAIAETFVRTTSARQARAYIAVLAYTFASTFAPTFAQGRIGGSVSLVSDYVYRGVSQSRGEPALQADFHYASVHGWSVGVWGSTVELNGIEGRSAELNAYAAYRWQWSSNWHSKVMAVHYAYPWNDISNYEYNEFVGSLSYRNRLFATVAFSFDSNRTVSPAYRTDKDIRSYELAGSVPLGRSFSTNLGIGYYDLPDPADYLYWNAGVSYDWRAFRAEISYIGSEDAAERLNYGRFAGDRVAATLSWRF
jgi:uncharacterized protein (TIGR02001 family)